MSIKLTGNGMWESSRIILPEHKAGYLRLRNEENAKKKPLLDVDAIEDIERKIAESYAERVVITLEMYDKYEDLQVTGVVERIDTRGKRIVVDGEWFNMIDIIDANYG